MRRRAGGTRGRAPLVLTRPAPLDTVENANGAYIPLEDRALSSCRRLGWAVVASVFVPPVVCAGRSADDGGGLVGWVESTRGAPVAGAVVSIFGKGIRGGSLITLADAQGQFVLPSLPAGSYTLRAIGTGHQPSAAQHVTVLPNRDALFTLSLTPVGEKPADEEAAAEAAPRASASGAGSCATSGARSWRRPTTTSGRHGAAAGAGASPEAAPLATSGPLAGSMELAATGGRPVPADPPERPARRRRLAPAAGPARRRRPLEPGRAGRRERGAGLAHGGGVRARARRRARGGGRRRLRGRRHAPDSRRRRCPSPTGWWERRSSGTAGSSATG